MSQNVERAKAIKLARKLMENKGRSDTETEFALNKLNDVMTTFNLTLTEITLATLDYKQVSVEATALKGDPMKTVFGDIARFTDTKHWRQPGRTKYIHVSGSWNKRGTMRASKVELDKYCFFGLQEDAEMAEFLYQLIKESLERAVKEYQASSEYRRINIRGMKRSALIAFKDGFVNKISWRLAELRREQDRTLRQQAADIGETDIVLVKAMAREDKFKEQVGISLTSGTRYYSQARGHSGAYANGSSKAASVNLSRPVTGRRSGQLLLA